MRPAGSGTRGGRAAPHTVAPRCSGAVPEGRSVTPARPERRAGAGEQIAHAHGPHAARLHAAKSQYDPHGVFSAIPLPSCPSRLPGTA